mmetsp:Transcript_23977/g.42470  ORF Transcript_23977/g.42470 Transcript_23977/m.42470 type:complete len:129 (-) Transcript_23977:1227-1613(-)
MVSRETETFDVIYKEGWLYKQSKYLKEWRRRWVVLTPRLLCSFKAEKNYRVAPTEQVWLRECSSVKSAEEETRQPNGFRVDSASRAYYFYTEDHEEKEAWIGAIGRAMIRPTVVRTRSEEEMLNQTGN